MISLHGLYYTNTIVEVDGINILKVLLQIQLKYSNCIRFSMNVYYCEVYFALSLLVITHQH